MSVAEAIERKLTQAFSPTRLVIRNESDRHTGHAGSPGSGESHFHVTVVSSSFAGKPRVQRHRMVYAALAEELAGPVHALALETLTPEEDRENGPPLRSS